LSKKIRRTEPRPGKKLVFITGWAGMRGVVSLASALAIPITLASGEGFPHRNLILCITFIVILVTLVFQGLTLPPIIRWLGVEADDKAEEQRELALRLRLARAVVQHIETQYEQEVTSIEPFRQLKARYERVADNAGRQIGTGDQQEKEPDFMPAFRKLLLEVVQVQRQELSRLRNGDEYSDELLRSKEFELDLEEARYSR
jgi:CPA1 family monovalent cation:H+ antiporter